jgi:uncharacterized protein (TIGR02145 family)
MKKAFWLLASVVLLCTVGCKKEKEKEASGPANQYTDARDGKTYKTVVIGTQMWMAENMNYAVAGSLCYDNKEEKCAAYGRLYTQEQARTACPQGYRLPSEEDFQKLEKFLGMSEEDADEYGSERGTDEGTKLKEGGSSGFNAKLAGYYINNKFDLENYMGTFWTSTEGASTGDFYYRRVYDNSAQIERASMYFTGNYGCVRCIK